MSEKVKVVLVAWARVFFAAVLTAYLAHLASGGDPVSAPWQAIIIAGIVAVGPVILQWLSPNETAFGRGSDKPAVDTASD